MQTLKQVFGLGPTRDEIGPIEAAAATIAIAGGLGVMILYVSYILTVSF